MFVLIRALTYASLFVGFLLVFLPAQILAGAGITRPSGIGPVALLGILATLAGAAVAIWCIATFVVVGKGTPAPFDPPRTLVVAGPYHFVSNPMYLGAVVALCGAALVFQSLALLVYAAGFWFATHLLVMTYEEPALNHTFGGAYQAYREQVPRWLPRFRRSVGGAG